MNNKGATLMEMIVIIAIIGIMSSVLVMSFNVVYKQKTSSCAESIDSYLDRIRLETMSKAEGRYMVLYKTDTGTYMASSTDPATFAEDVSRDELVADKNVQIEFKLSNSSSYIKVAEGRRFYLTFDRMTGGFGREYISSEYVDCIRISLGGLQSEKVIRLVTDTGKHYIE